MRKKFRPHQREAYEYAIQRAGIGLFMHMRLGKSLVATRWAKVRCPKGNILIIAPAATIDGLDGWLDQLKEERIDPVHLKGSTKQKTNQHKIAIALGKHWFVTNPEGFRAAEYLQKADWDCVIIDESPAIMKNPRAKITKVIRRKLRDVPFRAILCGEPRPESIFDYYEQMAWILGGKFMGCETYWKWREKYFIQLGHDLIPRHGIKKKIKMAIREHAFIKTAKQAGLFTPKVYETRMVDPPLMIRRIMKQIVEDFQLGKKEGKWTVQCRTWLAMLAGGIVPKEYDPETTYFSPFKLDEMMLVREELRDQKVIVWARFTREIKHIVKRLEAAKFKVTKLVGGQSTPERRDAIRRFQQEDVDTIVCQVKTGRFGLNLSAATAHIVYSNEWDWLTRLQLEKRADHMEKELLTPTLVCDLVSRGTVDEEVVATLRGKKVDAKEFMQKVLVRCRAKGSLPSNDMQ